VGWIALDQVRNMIMSIKCGKFITVGTVRNRTVAEISDLKIEFFFGVEFLRMRFKPTNTSFWAAIAQSI